MSANPKNGDVPSEVSAIIKGSGNVARIHDWTGKSHKEVEHLLATLVKAGLLLHGSNPGSEELHYKLEPRQGGEPYRASGRRCGVYATNDYEGIFSFALMSRRRIREYGLKNFTTSHQTKGGKLYIGVDKQEVLDFIIQNKDKVFTDGYVYVLDPGDFKPSHDAPHEYMSASVQHPRAIVRIGAHIADELYYSEGEDPTLYLIE